jgi:hypothetical protein
VTPLKKPHGHVGVVALVFLTLAVGVLWTTRPSGRPAEPAPSPRPAAQAVRAPTTTRRSTEPPPAVRSSIDKGPAIATGPLVWDESRTAHVYAPTAGWLERTREKRGGTIRAGETIGVIYSPEVYLTTLEVLARLSDFRSQELLDRPRLHLLRMGMRQDMLTGIERSFQPQAALPLIARVGGTIVVDKGTTGQIVDADNGDLFTISDPQAAWVYVDLPEASVAALHVGSHGRVTIDGLPGSIVAPVGFIAHRADGGKRTVRFDVHAPELHMPLDAQARVELVK